MQQRRIANELDAQVIRPSPLLFLLVHRTRL